MNSHLQNRKADSKRASPKSQWLQKTQCPKELRRWAQLMDELDFVVSLPTEIVVRSWGRGLHIEDSHEEIFAIDEDLERAGRSF